MARITNFGTLKSQVEAVLGRAPEDHIYQLVTDEVNRDLSLRVMEHTHTVAEAATIDLSAVDPEILSIISIYRDSDPRTTLKPATEQQIHRDYCTSGTPGRFAFQRHTLILDAPGTGENLQIRYKGRLDGFSDDAATNDVLGYHLGIYVYGALYHHAANHGDPRMAGWKAIYEQAKADAVKRDALETRAPGSPAPVRSGMRP